MKRTESSLRVSRPNSSVGSSFWRPAQSNALRGDRVGRLFTFCRLRQPQPVGLLASVAVLPARGIWALYRESSAPWQGRAKIES